MYFAIVKNGVVTNVIWLYPTTYYPNAVPCGDKAVQIGDTFDNGKFYRGETEVLSQVEDMQNALEILGVSP